MIIDETKVEEYTKEELAEFFEQLDLVEEEWKAEKAIVATRLQELMADKEEIIGDKIFSKVYRLTYKPTIEFAKEVGAIKEAIDTTKTNAVIKTMAGKNPEVITEDGKSFVKVGQQNIEVSESTFLKFKHIDEGGEE